MTASAAAAGAAAATATGRAASDPGGRLPLHPPNPADLAGARDTGGGSVAGGRPAGDRFGGGKAAMAAAEGRRGWEDRTRREGDERGKKKVKNLGRGAHCQWGRGMGTIIVWAEARAWWLVWGIISRLVGD